jgi:hypothetical protein
MIWIISNSTATGVSFEVAFQITLSVFGKKKGSYPISATLDAEAGATAISS